MANLGLKFLLQFKLLLNARGQSSAPERDCQGMDLQGLLLEDSYLYEVFEIRVVSLHGQTKESQTQE